MNKQIPFIIVGLIVLYIVLSISKERFDMYEDLPHRSLDLRLEPKEDERKKSKCSILKMPIPKAKGLITKFRENPSKYIRESMLLNKPNHNLGFQPSNVRYMDLMYNKPNQIGSLPIFNGKIPDNIKVPKLTQALKEKDSSFGES